MYLSQLTGHVADLSLKGSPYWMAPEVYYISLLHITLLCVILFLINTYFSYSLCKQ